MLRKRFGARPGCESGGGEQGEFDTSPVRAGCRYFFKRSMEPLLRREVDAQFERFRQTGLALDHVNGHLHFHLHPVVLKILAEGSGRWGIRAIRLVRDPWWLNAGLAQGRWVYRLSHGLVFWMLTRWAERRLRGLGWRVTDAVFGLLQDSNVDERYVVGLMRKLPAGCFELYSHPSTEGDGRRELEALVSPRVKTAVKEAAVELVRYSDL